MPPVSCETPTDAVASILRFYRDPFLLAQGGPMRTARLCFLLPLVLVLGGSTGFDPLAQTAAPGSPAARPADKGPSKASPFEARLDDDSVIRVHLQQEHVV